MYGVGKEVGNYKSEVCWFGFSQFYFPDLAPHDQK